MVFVYVALLAIGMLAPSGDAFAASAGSANPSPPTDPVQLRTEVVATYPHDVHAFTEGLLLHKGNLYESTGAHGWSTLRELDVQTGQIIRTVRLRNAHFGEGLALKGDRLVQLTYQGGVAFVYKLSNFKKVGELRYQGQGWGLCFDGTRFVMSNGSDQLVFRHARTFAVLGSVQVKARGQAVTNVNELECVGESVYANVFRTDKIVEISARDGVVRAEIDARNLLTDDEKHCLAPFGHQDQAVLNGIAYDPKDSTFLITGKLWPKLFRVRFVPQ